MDTNRELSDIDMMNEILDDELGDILDENYEGESLSAQEEYKCWWLLAVKGVGYEKAREKLIMANYQLLVKVAKSFERPYYDNDELIMLGMPGLIKAVDTYRGWIGKNEFSKYAYRCIKKEIISNIDTIRLDNGLFELERYISRIVELWYAQTGKSPSIAEISEYLNCAPEFIYYIIDNGALADDIVIDPTMDCEAYMINKDLRGVLDGILAKLPQKEANVLRYSFGFIDGHDWTCQEIARLPEYSCGAANIIEIKKETLKKIRRDFNYRYMLKDYKRKRRG